MEFGDHRGGCQAGMREHGRQAARSKRSRPGATAETMKSSQHSAPPSVALLILLEAYPATTSEPVTSEPVTLCLEQLLRNVQTRW
jgi:hypothetical protein